MVQKRKGSVQRKVDVDIGQTRPADNQTDSDALPISARNLDRPHCGAEENFERTSYEWQGVTGCHSCDDPESQNLTSIAISEAHESMQAACR